MNKLFITLALSAFSLLASAQSKQRATGDVNGDGKVDIEDVTCLVNQILNKKFEYITLYNGYTIAASSANTAQGTISGGGSVATGNAVKLTATPKSGYQFDGWYCDDKLISSANPYSFTPTKDMTIVGRFSLQTPTDTDTPGGTLDPGRDEAKQRK